MRQRIRTLKALAALLLLGGLWSAARAATYRPMHTATPDSVPDGVLYQGRIEENGVPITGFRWMKFELLDNDTGGNSLFNMSTRTYIDQGVFGVPLDIPVSALSGTGSRWLEISIGASQSNMIILTPRDPLLSVPYAKVAESVEGSIDISTGGLKISNASGDILYVSSVTGQVGIGTTVPVTRLSVSSTMAGATAVGLELVNPSASAGSGQSLIFKMNTGGNLDQFAAVEAVRDASGDTSMAWWTRTAGTPVRGVVVSSMGYVGISTGSPQAPLDVQSVTAPTILLNHDTAPELRLQRAGVDVLVMSHDGTNATLGTITATTMTFTTDDGNVRMRITPEGLVGINTATPDRTLDVSGNVRAANLIETSNSGLVGTPAIVIGGDLDTGLWRPAANTLAISGGGAEKFRINANGVSFGATAASAGEALKITGGDVVVGNPDTSSGGSGSDDLFVEGNVVIENDQVVLGASRFEALGVYTDVIAGQLFKVGEGSITVVTSGRVGIGATSPGASLEIVATESGGNPGIIFKQSTRARMVFQASPPTDALVMEFDEGPNPDEGRFGTATNSDLIFRTNATDRIRIVDSNGRVGISSDVPSAMLSVGNNATHNMNVAGTLVLGSPLAIVYGGTASTSPYNARVALDVPRRNGEQATGTWPISVTGSVATAGAFDHVPSTCTTSGTFAKGIDAAGAAICTSAADEEEAAIEAAVYDNDNTPAGAWTVNPGGNINFDNGTFFINVTNNRVGIGLTNPSSPLEVSGNASISGSLTLTSDLTIANGGTGQSSAAGARSALNLPQRNGTDATSGSWNINILGSAVSASSLTANGANCSAGQSPVGVDEFGVREGCFDVATQAEMDTHTGDGGAHSATSANTPNAIVRRGGTGDFSAGTITANLTGIAGTATNLENDPTDCAGGSFATAIDRQGDLTCAADDDQPDDDGEVPNNISINSNTNRDVIVGDGVVRACNGGSCSGIQTATTDGTIFASAGIETNGVIDVDGGGASSIAGSLTVSGAITGNGSGGDVPHDCASISAASGGGASATTAACDRLVGGGGLCGGGATLQTSAPSGQAWTITCSAAGAHTAYAICCTD